ncbi:MAG: sodium:solute symporter family protein [Candidatus Nealsonbacteria bacterium]|nr:sodium:solute symporter family protein [Candidatus Nealsonbacteria bacterium]
MLIFAVGVGAGRRRRGDGSPQDLLLAGRRIPLFVGVFTLTATWVGGGYINGTAEAVYDPEQGLFWAQAPWCYALALVLGGLFFAGKMRRLGFTTLLDPFEIRYGRRVAAGLFLPALLGEIFWSAAILVALGTTFGTILNLDFSVSILISAAVAIGYTVVGGLRSVAYTDVVQLLCILIGLGIAIPFALSRAGGSEVVVNSYFEQMPAFPQGSAVWKWTDMALMLILGGIPWQVYFQRVLASENAKAAVRLSYVAGIGCAAMAIPAVLIGAIGAVADWSATPAGAPPQSALVLPYVLQYLTPPVIGMIGLAAVAAAVMSSVDSSILSASSMFAWNVYRPLFRPHASDRETRCVVRFAIVAVGVAATALALSVGSVYLMWYLCADLVYVILFPQLLTALFDRRANRTGAISGAVVGLILRLGGGEPFLGLPTLIPYPLQTPTGCHFPFRTVAMLGGLATIWLVSRATASRDAPRPLTDSPSHAPDRS